MNRVQFANCAKSHLCRARERTIDKQTANLGLLSFDWIIDCERQSTNVINNKYIRLRKKKPDRRSRRSRQQLMYANTSIASQSSTWKLNQMKLHWIYVPHMLKRSSLSHTILLQMCDR